jgi:hypothetical protein
VLQNMSAKPYIVRQARSDDVFAVARIWHVGFILFATS